MRLFNVFRLITSLVWPEKKYEEGSFVDNEGDTVYFNY